MKTRSYKLGHTPSFVKPTPEYLKSLSNFRQHGGKTLWEEGMTFYTSPSFVVRIFETILTLEAADAAGFEFTRAYLTGWSKHEADTLHDLGVYLGHHQRFPSAWSARQVRSLVADLQKAGRPLPDAWLFVNTITGSKRVPVVGNVLISL